MISEKMFQILIKKKIIVNYCQNHDNNIKFCYIFLEVSMEQVNIFPEILALVNILSKVDIDFNVLISP